MTLGNRFLYEVTGRLQQLEPTVATIVLCMAATEPSGRQSVKRSVVGMHLACR